MNRSTEQEVNLYRAKAPVGWMLSLITSIILPGITATWFLAGKLAKVEERLALIEYRLNVIDGRKTADNIPASFPVQIQERYPADLVRDDENQPN